MKYIKRVSAVKPITGSIVDTTNIDDKTTNAYSANVIDGLVKDVYSTEEQVIGTWIDGKPIYRKCITFQATGTSFSQPFEIENLDKIINIGGFLLFDEYTSMPLPISNNGYYVYNYYSKLINSIEVKQSIEYSEKSRTLVLEYTKTTD